SLSGNLTLILSLSLFCQVPPLPSSLPFPLFLSPLHPLMLSHHPLPLSAISLLSLRNHAIIRFSLPISMNPPKLGRSLLPY
ncbi:hypothetical protein PMAYCL1PPCAC_19527, partial [Pristionchus mayeri]